MAIISVFFLLQKQGVLSLSCGIYCITNICNNKKYIGQSKHIEDGWKEHVKELTNNTHHNCHLQNSWNTYGSRSFSFSIIENCSLEELNDREDFWIKKSNSMNRDFGYNLRDVASTKKILKRGSYRFKLRLLWRYGKANGNEIY